MPVHDWTRVTAGTFHDFHLAWIAELRRALNGGLLPQGYYALAEQVAGDIIPDVLTLQQASGATDAMELHDRSAGGGTMVLTVADAPPQVSLTATTSEAVALALRGRRITIRHATGDRIVALIEIVSLGNKETEVTLKAFIEKAAAALHEGYHLLILDLWPPGPFDHSGIHAALWSLVGGRVGSISTDRPLTLAAYEVRAPGIFNAYVEPIKVGISLPEMPLFLAPEHYINVPLEATYGAAWAGLPERWRKVIVG
ncbi:MAG: DUF4058 domain-containing protein [Verrucomicrobia bacterium]|nr:MAG: DUF4058 domain-containing protein [Verrucomicrobiota bacterium]